MHSSKLVIYFINKDKFEIQHKIETYIGISICSYTTNKRVTVTL